VNDQGDDRDDEEKMNQPSRDVEGQPGAVKKTMKRIRKSE
jgi:hypothetical protein